MISFEFIEIGKYYDRKELTRLWNYKGHQAIGRGVITPKGSNKIILFVTEKKQASARQYKDYLYENYLYWDGEEKHGSDLRIINHRKIGDEIYLFYRSIHHNPFEYLGQIQLESFEIPNNNAPMKAVFKLIDMKSAEEEIKEHETEFISLLETEKKSIVLSRLGQGSYRKELLQLWNGCALTGFPMQEILIASHIKPWRDSNNTERLDRFNGLLLTPTYDKLFDKGLISFTKKGEIIISNIIEQKFYKHIGLDKDMKLLKLHAENKSYLEYHENKIFIDIVHHTYEMHL